jgi:tRNA acetyltransferase TAN1
MTLMGKATEEGLEKTAKEVLAPHFHTEPRVPTKVRSLVTLCY